MITDITIALTGILSAINELIMPATGEGAGSSAVAYAAVLGLPILGGVVAFGRRLIKKSR